MADKAISYGAIEQPFGEFAGWESKNSNLNVSKTRATATSQYGDEVASELHDEKTEASEDLQCNNDTNSIPEDIGALEGNYILTGININTSEGAFATMSLSGHNHAQNAHAAEPALRNAAHGLTVAKAFGATDFLGGTAGDTASAISGSLNIQCDHNDQNDGDGDHLVGENCNFRVEAKTTWVGVPSVAAEAGWDVTITTTTDENTGFQKTEVSGIKKLDVTEEGGES